MPALLRIILINTHMKGIVELNVTGHTNICGTNASGKTTLQRLLPVFYGEYPSRVVPATRDSFERWYLPYANSYIIYEYQRQDNSLCQAILSSTGTGVDYRFVSKGFDIEDYSQPSLTDEKHIVEPKEFSRIIKRQGAICTRILNTKEFRATIQNDTNILASGRDLPGFARLFSLCELGQNLRHIEKLAKAVHSKEGKMETIKAMVAAILEEDGIQPGETKLSPNKVDEWLKEVKLVKGFEALQPQFLKLEQVHVQHQNTNDRLGQLAMVFNTDKTQLQTNIDDFQQQLSELSEQNKHQDSIWFEQRETLNQSLAESKADIAKLESDLDAVEAQYDVWQDKDIDALLTGVESLPRWKNQLETKQSRYQLLTEKHQDIESSYHKQKSELQDNFNTQIDNYSRQKDQTRDELSNKKSQQYNQELSLAQDYQQQISDTKTDFQEQHHLLLNQQTELATLINNLGFTQDEQSQLDILEHEIKEAAANEDVLRQRQYQLDSQYQDLKQSRNQVTDKLESERQQFIAQQQKVAEIEALLFPGQNTLLEFLRKHQPNWQDNIGKLINPELLNRSDLGASIADSGESLFGVKIKLDAIESPQFAQSEIELQQQLEQAQARLTECAEKQDVTESKLTAINKDIRAHELQQSKLLSELNNAEQIRKRAQQDRESQLTEFQNARLERGKIYQQKQKKLQQQLSQLQTQQEQAIDELKDQQREAQMELSSHWQLAIGDLEQQLTSTEEQLSQTKLSLKDELKKLASWLAGEMADRGVDVDDIGTLKKEITQLKKDISHTEQNSHLTNEYRHWYDNYYLGHKTNWQQQLNKAKQQQSDANRQLQKRRSEHQQQLELTKTKQSRFESELIQSKQHLEAINSLIKQLDKLPLTLDAVDDKLTINQRVTEAQQLLVDREQQLSDIKHYIEHFDQKIAAQAGTGFYDTWERSRQECSSVNEQGIRILDSVKLVSHLDQLINELMPQRISAIREQGRIFGLALSEYYKLLKDIESHIGNQSQRISKEVDEELFLDGVSDSAVKIRSRISELEFWPELNEFNNLYQSWLNQGAHHLPSDDYAYSMKRVMEILGRSALTGGISKLLDIELHIKEGDSDLIIRTDRQLNESSSHGMAYLILCKFLLAFTRLLRGGSEAIIHWPIDELGTLHQSNIKKIFDACQNNRIHVVGAFPNPESEVLSLFNNRYLIDKEKKQLQVVTPQVSVISQRLQQKQTQSGAVA